MSPFTRKLILLLSLSFLTSLPAGCSLPNPNNQMFSLESERESVAAYLLEVTEHFTVKAVEPAHQSEIDKHVKDFEQALKTGQLNDYYKVPAFSILLAAGSEGSFFNTVDGAKKLERNGAVFAQAVVFNPGESAQVFKGQFSNGRFYFSGQQNISPANTSYLITLEPNLETEVYKGKLSAGSEGSFLNPLTGTLSPVAGQFQDSYLTPAQQADLDAKIRAYQPAIVRNAQEGSDYSRLVSGLKFVPPQEPLALAWTETFARLMRAYPSEMHQELTAIRGLPRQLLHQAWNQAMNRVRDRWIADCGSAPPDGGKIYPQRLPDSSPIPQGYHSEALDQVIAALPEFKQALQELMKLAPPARLQPFQQLLKSYQASDAEVFAKYNWQDEFAPPDCVKPILPLMQ